MRVDHAGVCDRVRGSVRGIIVLHISFTSHVLLLFPLATSLPRPLFPRPLFPRPLFPVPSSSRTL
jgi:hypothetical protein